MGREKSHYGLPWKQRGNQSVVLLCTGSTHRTGERESSNRRAGHYRRERGSTAALPPSQGKPKETSEKVGGGEQTKKSRGKNIRRNSGVHERKRYLNQYGHGVAATSQIGARDRREKLLRKEGISKGGGVRGKARERVGPCLREKALVFGQAQSATTRGHKKGGVVWGEMLLRGELKDHNPVCLGKNLGKKKGRSRRRMNPQPLEKQLPSERL